MLSRVLNVTATWLHLTIAALALALVAWAFVRVATRPFRHAGDLADRTEITMLHWGDRDEDRIVQTLVESFEQANPTIKIKRINAGADYATKLQTMIAAGDPPDLFFLNAYHLPIYGDQGILMDVEPFLNRDAQARTLGFELDDFIPEALNGFRFDGQSLGQGPLYGLPMSFTPMGFYYNKQLFDKAGVAYPTAEWTWNDFEAMARQITARTGIRGAAVDLRGAQLVRLMLWAQGIDLTSPDFRTVNTADPRVHDVFDRLKSWIESPEVFRIFGDSREELETSSSAFIGGRAAIQGIVGRWMVPTYRKIPTSEQDPLNGFEWGWAPMPRGIESHNMLYIAAWCIAADSQHPEEAWAVAKHFATPEGQSINSGLGLALPTLWSVARSEAFSNPAVQPRNDEIFLDAVPGSRPMTWPVQTKVTRAMKNAVESVLRTQSRSRDEALSWLQKEISEIYSSPLTNRAFPKTPWRLIVLAIAVPGIFLVAIGSVLWWRGRPPAMARRQEYAGVLAVSPWIVGLCVFVVVPMVVSLLLSCMKWSGLETLDQAQWVGLTNFQELFTRDQRFVRSIIVTVFYALIAVPLGQVAALGAAMLMANPIRGVNFFRSAWYLPTVLAGVAMAIMWWWVFDAENGLLNKSLAPILALFGRVPPEWFGKDARQWGVVAFSITSLWSFGGTMIIYLAGLQSIPKHLYEAAQIDGARWLGRFRNITLPMLSPVILFNIVIAIIASFQIFTQAYIMTRGGPNDATLFYVLYIYEEAFTHHEMGYASALAWVLFLVVMVLTIVILRLSRHRVHYEGVAT